MTKNEKIDPKIVAEVQRAIKAHFEDRSERIWTWVQRVGWIVAILVGASSFLFR